MVQMDPSNIHIDGLLPYPTDAVQSVLTPAYSNGGTISFFGGIVILIYCIFYTL